MLFSCSSCNNRFSVDDVKKGNFFPSTGKCSNCYLKLAKNKSQCFGKKKKYNASSVACGIECPDSTVCKSFVYHIKEY